MRTLMIILAGLILLLLAAGLAYLLKRPLRSLLPYFLGLWLCCAAVNMWIGVSQAGYGFMEELPIFVVIFGIPALVAFVLARTGILDSNKG